MGYKLRRCLADSLPPGLSSGERLVALEIADQANDQTRQAYGKDLLDVVARRAGFTDTKQVGKVLGKLSARGLELRVQIVKDGRPLVDKRGRPVFAYDGHQTTYQIPNLGQMVPRPGDHVVSQQGEHMVPRPVPSGPPLGPECSPAGGSVVPPAGDPSPHIPSRSPHLSSGAGGREAQILRNAGATEEETREIIRIIEERHRPRSLSSYLQTMAAQGDLEPLILEVRTELRAAAVRVAVAEARRGPECSHGERGGEALHPTSGEPLCPVCRLNARRVSA